MKILFIYPNQNPYPFPIAPIGILTLAAIIQEKGHRVEVVDLMFSSTPESDIERKISAFTPDLIGISIRNYNNQDPINFDSYIDRIASKTRLIRTLTPAPVICGGAGFTRLPQEILLATGANYGIAGEAEESFPQFIETLVSGQEIGNVPGIVYRDGSNIVQRPWQRLQDLNKYPFQDIGLIDYQQYLDHGGYVGIETKRGCPNSCVYCDDSRIYGKKVRLKNPKRVVAEIEQIVTKHGFRDFYFADSLFSLPTSHLEAICREIIGRNLKIGFEMEATPVGISIQNAKLLKQAGCIGIFFTIDSGSPAMLKSLRKSFEVEDIRRAASAFSSAKLPYAICVNLGGPGETRETFSETIELLKSLPDYSAIFFGLGFKVEKGTALDQLIQSERTDHTDIDYIRDGLYFAKGFGPSFLRQINQICKDNAGWMKLHSKKVMPSPYPTMGGNPVKKKASIKPGWLMAKKLSVLMKAFEGGMEINVRKRGKPEDSVLEVDFVDGQVRPIGKVRNDRIGRSETT